MNRRFEVDAVRGDERVGLLLDAASIQDGFELVISVAEQQAAFEAWCQVPRE